jgi:hypothetical protein
MLTVNVAVVIGVFLHKITLPPFVPYIHLLVDYHFGFIKRALVGEIVSLFTAEVPIWLGIRACRRGLARYARFVRRIVPQNPSALMKSSCRCSPSWRARRSP